MMENIFHNAMDGTDAPLWDSPVFRLLEKPELNVLQTYLYELPVPDEAWTQMIRPGLFVVSVTVQMEDYCIFAHCERSGKVATLFELYPQWEDIDRFEYNVACDMWACLRGLTLPYMLVGHGTVLVKFPPAVENDIWLAKAKRPFEGMFI